MGRKNILKTEEEFLNELKIKQPNIHKLLNLKSPYTGGDNKIIVEVEFGDCSVYPNNLLRGKIPSIRSAINKKDFFVNQANSIHKEVYDYSDSSIINTRDKIKIRCNIHGIFEQRLSHHLKGHGCTKCGNNRISKSIKNNSPGWRYKNWINKAETSKNFDSFKVYIIKCWNAEEEFLKIGKTFQKIETRFISKSVLPYDYQILYLLQGEADFICKLESSLHKNNKKYKYVPKNKFSGMHECYKEMMWAEDRANGYLPYIEFEEIIKEFELLPWMVDAVENQAFKYRKQKYIDDER